MSPDDARAVVAVGALKRLFFNTKIFDVCLVGARLYYRPRARLPRRIARSARSAHTRPALAVRMRVIA